MFNLIVETRRLQQLKHDKVHGLSVISSYDSKVQHTDDTPFDVKAEQEHTYMLRRFRNHSADFGKRLSKRKGQYHRPGGGFAGHIIKGG